MSLLRRASPERRRLHIGSLPVDEVTLEQVLAYLHESSVGRQPCLIVTPNLTNAAIFETNAEVRKAYQRADLILADGWPVKLAAKVTGNNEIDLVPGSLLLPTWLARLRNPSRILAIGGKNGLATASALMRLNDLVEVDFDDSLWLTTDEDKARLDELIDSKKPDVLLLLLGSPKQEILALSALESGFNGVVLCLGAAGDFIAGLPSRAPEWVQKAKLEWLYRIQKEPARLTGRYLRSVGPFLRLVTRSSSPETQ